MDAVKQQIQRLQQQLAGLDASQKMLTGTLAAVMVISVAWFASRAGSPEMAPVLDQPVTASQLGRMRTALAGAGIAFEVKGDRLMVPADRQLEAISALGFNNAMPRNSGEAFDRMLAKTSAWDPAFKTKEFILQAKQQTLGEILRRSDEVIDANVMLDMHQERRIGRTKLPSAAIALTTASGTGQADKQLVKGAIDLVVGSVSGLEPSAVRVTVNGYAQRVQDDSSHFGQATELFEQQAQAEAYYTNKIYDIFPYMPKLVASVTVDVEATSRAVDSTSYDADNIAVAPTNTTSRTLERTQGAPGGEAGAVPNTGNSVWDDVFAGGETETQEETTESTDAYVGQQNAREITPAGKPTAVAAAVRIPMSAVRKEFDAQNPDVSDPSYDDLQPVVLKMIADVRAATAQVTGIVNDTRINVETYSDDVPLLADAAADTAGFSVGGVSLGAMVNTYGKEAGLGLLALVGLFAVLRMVKQSTPDAITDIPNINDALSNLRGEMAVGEAGEGAMLLDATEADPDQIEVRQMTEQVQDLVSENPDAAAQLMRRWLNQ